MKNSHAHAVVLLLAALLAAGCSAPKPANFSEVAKEAVKNVNLREMTLESPLTILVSIDSERNVYFRKEKVGTTEDIKLLKEKVKQAIERNKQNAKDDEEVRGSGTIFICAPDSFKYGDVTNVINAVKEAGGDPVGLQTEGCAPPR